MQIEKYFGDGDEEVLPKIFESILKRKLKEEHDDTDDELMDKLQTTPLDDVGDEEFESDFSSEYETDEDIENLYDARDIAMKRMVEDGNFNMDNRKWDEMIKEAIDEGDLDDTKECEEILEDMLMWENVIPDSIKKKIKEKYNKIAAMVETGDLTPEQGYDIYQKFEEKMIKESVKLMEKVGPPYDAVPGKKKDLNDPPGEGPILRWQTRVVFAAGGDAWHPKNRKVKLAVTVKELGLSKHQFRRLRELVGKRYNPGKDELTITSERFEHREENRKDCLRTLFSVIEEAGKARIMVEDVRTSHIKNRLRANDKFMETLRAKKMKKEASALLAA